VSWKQQLGRWVPLAGVLAALPLGAARAQHITIDGSLSPAQTLVGPSYMIGANLGKQVGGNLFHSFGVLGLNRGETANFTGPASVSNIIGRVTGGVPSSIDGTIKSSIAGANLYLINPAGIVFGPHAAVNVSGSFHAAAADYLRLSDGAKFQATTPGGSTLSAAPPAAFGFLNAAPPAITVDGSSLSVPTGQTLGLAGGSVNISGATLRAPAGTIHVTGVAGAGEIPLAPGAGKPTVAAYGPVNIIGGSTLDVSDPVNLNSGGSIYVRAGTLTVDASEINVDNYGSGPGGRLLLDATNAATLSDGADVHSTASAAGSGAPISIKSGLVLLDGGAGMNPATGVFSSTTGSAPGGSITVNAQELTLHDSAAILAETRGFGSGGGVTVSLGDSLIVDSGSSLGTSTSAAGNAGNVSVGVSGPVTVDMTTGALSSVLAGIGSLTAGTGDAGSVTLSAGNLTITNYGQVASTTFRGGNAGDISVLLAGLLSIGGPTDPQANTGLGAESEDGSTGNSGNVAVKAGNIFIGSSDRPVIGFVPRTTGGFSDSEDVLTGISVQAEGRGLHAGIITVSSLGALSIADGGVITAQTFGLSNGGTAEVTAGGPLTLSGVGSGIFASAAARARGSAGSVAVSAPEITISDGAAIASSTGGPGDGGDVSVSATGDIILNGTGPQITASSTGTGNAGSIMVSATDLRLDSNASISTEAASANGGNITIDVGNLLYLLDSHITTSVDGAKGNGGNITIDPAFVVLNNSQIVADAVGGNGGNITIDAGSFLASADSLVSATSQLGISGSINISGQNFELDKSLAPLPGVLRDTPTVSRDRCAAHGGLDRSTLVDAGRGGLPQDPDATIPALYLAGRGFAGAPLTVPPRGASALPFETAATTLYGGCN
jgi:filamentous hemagglutinin family protein